MSDRLINPTVSARVQYIRVLVNHWYKASGMERQESPVETGRRDPDNGERVLVQVNRSAHYARIVLKLGVPKRMSEDDVGGAVRAVLIRRVNEPAKIRPNAQGVEVVAADDIEPDAGWIFARIEAHLIEAESCQTVKAAVTIAQVDIVGIRLRRVMIAPALEKVETLRPGHIQRTQDQRIHNAKNHGVRANGQCQCPHGHGGKARRFAHLAESEAYVLDQCPEVSLYILEKSREHKVYSPDLFYRRKRHELWVSQRSHQVHAHRTARRFCQNEVMRASRHTSYSVISEP